MTGGPRQVRWRQVWICLAVFTVVLLLSGYLYEAGIPSQVYSKAKGSGSSSTPVTSSASSRTSSPPIVFDRPPENYTRTLVIASIKEEDTSWVEELAKEDPNLATAVYVADDPSAKLTVPMNKGHEVMVYLTYIIDNYDSLADVSIFMHAHETAWHNNDLLDSSSPNMVRHLRTEHILQNGYANLRCHFGPGCPNFLEPAAHKDTIYFPESRAVAEAWPELFPDVPPPEKLSQTCCGQFAVSKDHIRAVPREKFEFYRSWLFNTTQEDRWSGRVFEYVWQYIFTGIEMLCPEEHVCYCEAYGICFDGKEKYDEYFGLRDQTRQIDDAIKAVEDETKEKVHELSQKITELSEKMVGVKDNMDAMKAKAMGMS